MSEMLISFEAEDKFHASLLAIDAEAARAVRRGGCPRAGCLGKLHAGNYARKVRGLSASAESAGRYSVRFSLCCSRRGCRRRATPPSVRFFGRYVYAMEVLSAWGIVGLVKASAPPMPSRQTLRRWNDFVRARMPRMPVVALLMAALVVPSAGASTSVVVALFEATSGASAERIAQVHRLLSPLTTVTVPPERARWAMVR